MVFGALFCLSLIGLEAFFAWRLRRGYYRWESTLSNLLCAAGHVTVDIFLRLPVLALYLWCARFAPANDLAEPGKWVVLFVLVDFLFYLSHYLNHKLPWLWAIHGVHHQGEDFNFSTGLRLPWLHKLGAFWVPLPAALLGFELSDYAAVALLQASLQTWTHTRFLPRRIPVLEWVLVTPSHHRVHHGQNDRYRDKNFAGILSVWDYLFGTYCPETEPVRFGVRGVSDRVNPFSNNFILFSPRRWRRLDRSQLRASASACLWALVIVGAVFALEASLTTVPLVGFCLAAIAGLSYLGWRADHPTHPSPVRSALRPLALGSLIFLGGSCASAPEVPTVTIIKQWHLSANESTRDFEKAQNLPQASNQLEIYRYLDTLLTERGRLTLIVEGCDEASSVEESFKLVNGWKLEELRAIARHSDFYKILVPVPLKLKLRHPTQVTTLCGDSAELIRQHQLSVSDAKGFLGFYLRLKTQGSGAKFDAYHRALEEVLKQKVADPLAVSRELALKNIVRFEELVLERNALFLKHLVQRRLESPVIVVGGLHAQDLMAQLTAAGIRTQVLEPENYPTTNEQIASELRSALE